MHSAQIAEPNQEPERSLELPARGVGRRLRGHDATELLPRSPGVREEDLGAEEEARQGE